jgi:hypothetical protein
MRDPAAPRTLLHVGEAQLAGVVLLQCVQLARCDLVSLDGVRLSMEGAHIFDEAASDRGRQFNPLLHGSKIASRDCESKPLSLRLEKLGQLGGI